MLRKLSGTAAILLLSLWLLGPVLQNVDPWDIFPDTGDDLVLLFTGLAACAGLLFCLALWAANCKRPIGVSIVQLPVTVWRPWLMPSLSVRSLLPPLRV